jgi:electron-transferring-flavoprotein dehydrogenase
LPRAGQRPKIPADTDPEPETRSMADTIVPIDHQPDLPKDDLLVTEPPDEEALPMDVAIVGGGPAGLACAIELARLAADGDALADLEIAVLEKAGSLGEHNLSGAVINPGPFRSLFPDLSDEELPFRRPVDSERVYLLRENGATRIPTPPPMRNHGYYVASISEVTRWLGEQAERMGVNLITGYAVGSLLIDDDRVAGVRTVASGLDRDGNPGSAGYMPPTDVLARVTALAEGTRGALSQAYLDWQGVASRNPQIYALGVKEVWETREPLDAVVHTLGWPLPKHAFGGSFMYPLADDRVAVGLVVGLDYDDATLDPHALFQRMKTHPLFREVLEGGEMLEWGAKTIPEGGYYALPGRRSGNGVVILGDSAGFVDVPSLKGIHYAVQSGIFAARAIYEALENDDVSAASLARYDTLVNESFIVRDLRKTRNMRLAFKDGFYAGGFKAALMTATGGRFPGGKIDLGPDAAHPKTVEGGGPAAMAEEEGGNRAAADGAGVGKSALASDSFVPDGELTFSKVDAVFKSGNQTRDDIPPHLIPAGHIPPQVARMYAAMCPAGVYELGEAGELVINAPNCVDCKATDVLGPRWTPREGGSGTKYREM